MDIWPVAREAIEHGGAIRRRRSCPNCAQFVKEGKGAIKCTRLSCRSFAANAVRLQLRALAYNLGNFMRTLAMPQTAEPWSLKPAREADQDRHQGRQPWAVRYVSDGRSRGAAADVPGDPVADRRLRAPPAPHDREIGEMRRPATAEVRLDLKAKRRVSALRGQASRHFGCQPVGCDRISLWCASLSPTDRQSEECRLKWRCSGALRESRARCRCGRLSQRL